MTPLGIDFVEGKPCIFRQIVKYTYVNLLFKHHLFTPMHLADNLSLLYLLPTFLNFKTPGTKMTSCTIFQSCNTVRVYRCNIFFYIFIYVILTQLIFFRFAWSTAWLITYKTTQGFLLTHIHGTMATPQPQWSLLQAKACRLEELAKYFKHFIQIKTFFEFTIRYMKNSTLTCWRKIYKQAMFIFIFQSIITRFLNVIESIF